MGRDHQPKEIRLPAKAERYPSHAPICWVCGSLADSREHRLKKSDLVSKHGRGPYLGDNALLHFIGGDTRGRPIQGPDAKKLKYEKSLCAACNNEVSQPADQAYQTFMNWVSMHEKEILETRKIDLRIIFGAQMDQMTENLVRYFCKSLGCRINSASRPVPGGLASAVVGGALPSELLISFSVLEEIAKDCDVLNGFIGKSDLIGNSNLSDHVYYQFQEVVSWFCTSIHFNSALTPGSGTPLTMNTEVLDLGSIP